MSAGLEPAGFVVGALRVAHRHLAVWRRYALPSAVGNFGEPLLYLLALGLGLGQFVPQLGGMSYAEFIAPGLMASTAMYTATFEGTFGSYTRLTMQGTFDALLATPLTVSELIAGEILFTGIKATVGAACVLTIVALFGLAPSWLSLLVVPLAFLEGLMFGALALTVTSLSRSYEFFNYYFTLLVAPMFLFGGVFFPLDRLPRWVQTASLMLPLTHVVAIARSLVRGTPSAWLLAHLAAIVAFSVVGFSLCTVLLTRRLRS